MPRGGYRPGAGRPPGSGKTRTKDRAVIKKLKAAEASVVVEVPAPEAAEPDRTPPAEAAPVVPKVPGRFKSALEWIMDVINDPDAPLDAKVRLASAALPFQTPRLEPVGQGKKEQKEEAAKAASAGRFATPAAPRLVADNTKG